jgi:protein-arginine kinase activator protein McsA
MANEFELYFYFDGDHESESEDATIASMCCDCHNRDWGYLGFYYKGPLTEWKYVCRKCGTTIKDGITEGQPATSEV